MYFFHFDQSKYNNRCKNQAIEKITHSINKANLSAEDLLQKLTKDNYKQVSKEFVEKGLDLIIKRDEAIVFWTSNTVPLFQDVKQGNYYFKTNKSLYRLYTNTINDSLVATAFFAIKKPYPKDNKLDYQINPVLYNNLEAEFYTKPVDGSLALKVEGSKNPLYVQFIGNPKSNDRSIWIFCGFLLMLISWFYFRKKFKIIYLKFILFYLIYVIALILWVYTYSNTELFKPYIYASSWYFQSIGHLLFLILALIPLFIYLSKKIFIKYTHPIFLFISGVIHLGVTGFVISEIVKLLKDSKISYSFYQIGELSIYTLISLFCMTMGLYLVHLLYKVLFVNSGVFAHRKNLVWVFGGQLLTSLILYFAFDNDLVIMSISLGYNFIWHLLTIIKILKRNNFLRGVVRLVLSCILVSFLINRYIDFKELELRKLLATRLTFMEDNELIKALESLGDKIHNDNSIIDYLTCETAHKPEFEQHLQNVYLSGYMNNYNVKITTFDIQENSYPNLGENDFKALNNSYLNLYKNRVSDNFISLSKKERSTGYLGKFEICNPDQSLGYVFIEISPKIGFNFVKYTHFWEPNTTSEAKTGVSSFAIYKENNLIRRSGGFPYPLDYDLLRLDKESNNFSFNKYSHFTSSQENYRFVTSNPSRTWVERASTFISLILSAIALWVFFNLIPIIPLELLKRLNRKGRFDFAIRFFERKFKTFNPSKMLLSNRISLAMLGTVYLIIFISIGFSMNYEDSNFEVRHKDYLRTKLYDIVNIIKNNNDFNDIMVKHEYNSLYNLADHFKNDIRIYSPDGILEFSTDTKIFDMGISNKLCNPKSFEILKYGKNSEFTHKEKLGEVEYFAAYYTLLDNNLTIKGFLCLPYFSKTKEFEEETGTFLALFINLFGFLFLLAGFIAWYISRRISMPLIQLRSHIGKMVSAENKYQPVPWKINDEIGMLVKEYNQMLVELEINTKLLGQQERESAWREMAKQVAHEIKNPLTPMKLSLQHLQRSFKMADDNDAERFLKTTNMLIERIDSLSLMAEEFSSFAQMPEPHQEVLSLNEELENLVQLYENTPNFRVSFKSLDEDINILADKQSMNRVFINIVNNAQQATNEKTDGKLNISLKIENKMAIVSFKDNGVGIAKDLYSKIFTPNFSTKNSGMGLGLAMSKKIMKSIKGDISFESKLKKGTIFFLEIPIIDNSSNAKA